MTRYTLRLASTLFVGIALVGCGSAATETAETTAANQSHTGSDQRAASTATSGGELANRDCRVDAVYFAYDSNELDGRARSTLESNAHCLSQRSGNANVVGMTDPRGTEEYNLALGDRRARTVTEFMGNLGVDSGRMQVRSVGEEYASGEDETGWSRDRRADIELR